MPAPKRRKTEQKKQTVFANHKSDFISELSGLIGKWRALPGKEAQAYATAYENVLYALLTPEQTNEP
jgi:hypothetical protein